MRQTLGNNLGWKLVLLARLQPDRQLWLLPWVSSLLCLGSQDWYPIGGEDQTVLVVSKSQKARWAPMSLGPQEDPEESQSGWGRG